MAGGPAGAVALAGSSAGFAAAGGLDVKTEDVVATTHVAPVAPAAAAPPDAAATTTSVQYSPDDPLRDNTLPDDVAELQSMVRKNLILELQGVFC